MVQRITRPSTSGLPPPEITGAVGTAPPPDAPREVATGADTPTDMSYQNLHPGTLAALSQEHDRVDGGASAPIDPTNIGLTARELAAKHERVLQPLRPPGAVPVSGTDGPGLPAPPPGFEYFSVEGHGWLLRPTQAAPVAPVAPVAPPPPIEPHQLAGSNSDSPSRGVPRAITDPGKVITGGFGAASQAMYYPLDGSELRRLVEEVLVPHLVARLQDDLRFQMAITYPRVGVSLELKIDGYPDDQAFTVAETVVVAQVRRAEVQGDGDEVVRTAPDQLRAEAGLSIPRLQSIPSGGGAGNRQLVDVVDERAR